MNPTDESHAEWQDAPTTWAPPAPPTDWLPGAPETTDIAAPSHFTGVTTRPVRPADTPRRRRGGAVLIGTLCLISAVGGGVAAVGANNLMRSAPASSAASPDARTVIAVPTATPATDLPTATTPAGPGSDSDSDVVSAAAAIGPAVVTIQTTTGQLSGTGSGVIVTADGYILTNHHVVGSAKAVTVLLADGRALDGTVVGVDTLTDLAIVKVDGSDLPTAPLGDSSTLQAGQRAIAIGSPLGDYPGSVTQGIVSGLDRAIDVADQTTGTTTHLQHLIQTDAAINPGNSGGPLLDADGRVIGINTAEASNAQGIGFAIPIDLAKPIVDQATAGKSISRPWIGINYQVITPALAAQESLAVDHGAWIHATAAPGSSAVVAGSPAADAGLRANDIITAIDGAAIDADHPLDLFLLAHAPGDTVTLSVLRDGSTIKLDVTLGTRPAALG
ncbi:MAG: trypsin-like peptidase domain-containing protein [Candidatus Limnocylindrales bacterium]